MQVGIFLARMQPLHDAHLYMIEKACKENDKVVVILGSANKKDMVRNPFDIQTRRSLLYSGIEESLGQQYADMVEVFEIPDWSTEDDAENAMEWGKYFYYNVVSRIGQKTFSIYYSDDPSIIKSWFEPEIQERINFRIFERSNLFEGLSATKIRQAFEVGDELYVRQYCPPVVVRRFDELKRIWDNVRRNPTPDYSMD